ncbi:MAG: site-specific integrase [Deltaproteobacteria bacterium]|nr:MAG: site-specific integrase [Deltaproteobacteria bacterium]
MKRIKTDKPGVFFRLGQRIGGSGKEKIYYVIFKKDGKFREEKVGRQYADQMSPARAAIVRSDYIEGRRLPAKEEREKRLAEKKAERNKPTISNLWKEYKVVNPHLKGMVTDQNRFQNHIEPLFGEKIPEEIQPLDIDRLRLKKLKDKAPATIRNSIELLRRIINFGIKRNRCIGLAFKLELPKVNNETTEDLTQSQLEQLLESIEKDENIDVGNMMLIALYTGMRRGEIFKLQWKYINLKTGFILLKDPKGGPDQKIPINDMAKDLLNSIIKSKSPYVFPGLNGRKRTDTGKAARRIRDNAGLPKDFRPMHGLRHAYASMLASSGKVDMYVLQKLMTHKSPKMTQRYAHLRDEALKDGAGQIDAIFNQQKNVGQGKKVVNMKGKR